MKTIRLIELTTDKIYYCKNCAVYYHCIAFYNDMENFCYKCGNILIKAKLVTEKKEKEKK